MNWSQHRCCSSGYEKTIDTASLQELPETWEWIPVGTVTESMTNGLYKPTSYYKEDGTASLRMYNIEGGRIIWSGIRRVQLTQREIENYKLEPGDILVNRVNSSELVGKAAVIPEHPLKPCSEPNK
jgi:type I restriction enzyme S subunit